MKAVIPRSVFDDIVIDVTDEERAIGVAEFECPSCEGTGVVTWLPHKDEAKCVECSGRGTRCVSV